MPMTENETRMLLHRSSLETAHKLVLHCGLPRARTFTERWIRVLANFKRLPTLTVAFWCAVAIRLKAHRPGCVTAPNDFERRSFDLMMARVGMKKGAP